MRVGRSLRVVGSLWCYGYCGLDGVQGEEEGFFGRICMMRSSLSCTGWRAVILVSAHGRGAVGFGSSIEEGSFRGEDREASTIHCYAMKATSRRSLLYFSLKYLAYIEPWWISAYREIIFHEDPYSMSW